MTPSLCLKANGPTTIVTLNRPDKRNALSLDLIKELIDCFRQIAQNRSIRCVILAATGVAFSSGHDLTEMLGKDINDYRRMYQLDSISSYCIKILLSDPIGAALIEKSGKLSCASTAREFMLIISVA